MNKMIALTLIAALVQAQPASPAPSKPAVQAPSEIVGAASPSEWVEIAAQDLLVMDLEPDRGRRRRVTIQIMPAPLGQGWAANVRTLAHARTWDNSAVTRVQDNYVAQWGIEADKTPLPAGLVTVSESDYALPLGNAVRRDFVTGPTIRRDPYAVEATHYRGWPIARDARSYWPVHCYGTVGVGRDMSPDTGTGAELYAVIGHAPRHLDRNIGVIGRVVAGIENLSALPRGSEALGFYKTEAEHTRIRSVQLASDMAESERPRFAYLSTEGPTFARYAEARANRRDAFFISPAGGADICNIPVPIRELLR